MRKYTSLIIALAAILIFDCIASRIKIEQQQMMLQDNEKHIAFQDSIIASYEKLFDEMVKP